MSSLFLRRYGRERPRGLSANEIKPGGTSLSGCRAHFSTFGLSIGFQRARQACPSEPFLGGTCLSGPPCDVRSSVPVRRARQACPSEKFRRDLLVRSVCPHSICHCLRRGLKSRAESGAKAPHSTSRRDLVVRSAVRRSIVPCHWARQACPSIPE